MWVSLIRGTVALAALTFMSWVLVKVLNPILEVANAGPHADHDAVVRIGGYFELLTVENVTLISALAVAVYLLGRAAVERRVTR